MSKCCWECQLRDAQLKRIAAVVNNQDCPACEFNRKETSRREAQITELYKEIVKLRELLGISHE